MSRRIRERHAIHVPTDELGEMLGVGDIDDLSETALAELREEYPEYFVDRDPPNPNDPDAVGQRLQNLRDTFNPETIRRSTKSKKTYAKHQSNHERFIIWLYENRSDLLHLDFAKSLDDISAEIDYSSIDSGHSKYRRRGGKLSKEERRKQYRIKLLRDEVKDALGPAGTTPTTPTVKFEELQADLDIFLKYLTEMRKTNGGLFKPGAYAAYRSSFVYLFSRYKIYPDDAFRRELQEAMEGVKRITNEAVQSGEGNIYDGDRPLTWGLYEQFNKWFLAEGTEEGIFACLFSKLTCNLACRGNSTSQVCTKHVKWLDDCLEIPFAHGKDQQTGDNQLKKLPRHCYSNPLNCACDLPSALLHYFVMNPDVINNPEECLFRGAIKAQSQRFSDMVDKIKNKYKTIIERDFRYELRDIGVHSWRKCAHSKLNTGSTAGPSGAAACIRGGHSMGKNRDVYIVHEKASDTYCGRILQGLPEHSPEFAVSYPDFVPLDLEESMKNGVSATELANRQAIVDEEVHDAIVSMFGAENLANFPTIEKLLRIGLASHLQHLENYSGPVYPTNPTPIIGESSCLRLTPLYTNPRIQALKEHVCIAMPWESHYKYFKPASGLPPHVIIYAHLKEVQMKVDGIPDKIEELLDRRNMMGNLSLDQIVRAVEAGPRMSRMSEDLAALRAGIPRATPNNNDERTHNNNGQGVTVRLHAQFVHSDGKTRRVPPSWTFPKLNLQPMYVYWHCGDPTNNIPPAKHLMTCDVNFLGKGARGRISELRRVMGLIDLEATDNGHPPSANMDHRMANTCYYHGESAIAKLVSAKTPSGKDRLLDKTKWTTIARLISKALTANSGENVAAA